MPLADAGDEDDASSSDGDTRVEVIDGRVNLILSEAEQARIDLRVEPAEARVFSAETHGFGRVVDVTELVKLRTDYSTKRAELRALNIEIEAKRSDLERLQSMYDDGALVSFEQLHRAKRDLQESRTRVSVLEADMAANRMLAVQRWGAELGGLIGKDEAPLMDDLVQRRQYLVIASLGPGRTLEPGNQTMFIAADGDRAAATQARILGPAPDASALQGETHYLLAAGPSLRAGMRVDVWAALGAAFETGAAVPKGAVVWYGGRRWVYVRRGDDRFERKMLESANGVGADLFVTDGIEAGEQIVVRGGQTLLAEEFRWSIPDEDEDE